MSDNTESPSPSPSDLDQPVRRIGIWRWIGTISIMAIFAVPLWFAVRGAIESNRRTVCKGHLKQIVRALLEYHEAYGSFPPAYTVGKNGEILHSWRSLILPYIDEVQLYSQIKWDEPWDSPHNKKLSEQDLEIYTCPSDPNSTKCRTNYFAVVDRASAWPEQYAAKISDIFDGTSNTMLLVEANNGNVNWMQPRDLSRSEAIAWIRRHNTHGHSHSGGSNVGLGDGTVRFVSDRIDSKVLNSLTSINGGTPLPGVDWPNIPDMKQIEFSEPSPATDLRQTKVWPVTEHEIVSGMNLVYCCSFQLAWARARQFANGSAIELEGRPPLAAQLNTHSFSANDLSVYCYVANAGPGDTVVPLIEAELKQRFPEFRSALPSNAERRAFVAYAYLYKNLPFHVSFDRLLRPLVFRNKNVASFGIADVDLGDIRHAQLGTQVRVLDYVSDDDFIIRLIPRGGTDEIVLARLQPEKTLAETIQVVRKRCADPHGSPLKPELQSGESLVVPVLSLNVTREFNELLGRSLLTEGQRGLYVGAAQQIIRFQLDENGAKVESEALIIGDFDDEGPGPPKPRKLVFDKPFLIWLRETQASEPYFVAWVDNAEFMEPFAK